MIKIEFVGLDALKVRLGYMRKRTREGFQTVVFKACADHQKKARDLVPKDTKTLMRSIQFRLEKGGFQGIVRASTNYAGFVEFGTVKSPAQPFMGPAFDLVSPGFMQDLKNLGAKL